MPTFWGGRIPQDAPGLRSWPWWRRAIVLPSRAVRNREILSRQFRLLLELSRHPEGQSSERLAKRLSVSRATVDRDLALLRDRVGLPIERVRRTGEIWHRLRELPLSSIAASPLQIAALRLAREALSPLDGTALVGELDALLALLPNEAAALPGLDLAGKPQRGPARIVAAIELAMKEDRRLSLRARTAAHGGEERSYLVDPLLLRVVDDELYLLGWSVEKQGARTFKVARMLEATVGEERATAHPEVDAERAFHGAVKAWSGELASVRVRLSPAVAWLAGEYPLVAGQRVEIEPDGSAVVAAEVAGLVEASRWVLSWGPNAVALDPPALRARVQGELGAALAGYAAGDGQVRSCKVSGVEGAGGSLGAAGWAESAGRGEDT